MSNLSHRLEEKHQAAGICLHASPHLKPFVVLEPGNHCVIFWSCHLFENVCIDTFTNNLLAQRANVVLRWGR